MSVKLKRHLIAKAAENEGTSLGSGHEVKKLNIWITEFLYSLDFYSA